MSALTTTGVPAGTVWRVSSHSGSHYGGNCVEAALIVAPAEDGPSQ
jgi:Domain of unknown function (DUF397)